MRCNRLRSWIAAPGDENAPVVRRRRNTLARESPLRCMARGPRVPLIAAASAWVCVLAEDPSGDAPPAVVREEVVSGGGAVRAGRRAGHRQELADRLRAHAGGGKPLGEPDPDV